MMVKDWSLLYHELVRLANPQAASEKIEPPQAEDDVTKECKAIDDALKQLEKHLAQLRPQYLALAGPRQLSEKDKSQVDYEVRAMLQAQQKRLRQLEKLEHARTELAKPQGSLARLLSNSQLEGAEKTLAQHRQGMFYYLNQELQRISATLADLQRVRLARQATPGLGSHSSPYATSLHGIKPVLAPQDQERSSQVAVAESQSTPEPSSTDPATDPALREQMLKENDQLLQELSATLNKAQHAEQSLREISEMQTELSTHLAIQSEKLMSLHTDVELAASDIGGANTELENAKRRNRRASKIITYTALGSAIILFLIGR